MNFIHMREKAITYINELRKIREDYFRRTVDQASAVLLIHAKSQEYESSIADPESNDDDVRNKDMHDIVKWHYYIIMKSMFGNRTPENAHIFDDVEWHEKHRPFPYMLSDIELLFPIDDKIDTPNISPPQQEGESKETLPTIIQMLLQEGLLNDAPVNGKYLKKADKGDKDILKWIFDYSGYEDSLTYELYMKHIQTACKPAKISDYICRARNVSK